jgi:hypothetical protein
MKRLWLAAALAPLSFAATMAHAQKTISSGTSTPISTSGVGGDITIDSGGSIVPTTAGTSAAPVAAVTVNSYNNASNAGGISFSALNYTAGILVQGSALPTPSSALLSITNTGSITDNETTGYKDTNGDYIDDTNGSNAIGVNLFAAGTNRFGIETTGSLAFNGSISNSGTITIIGENSAGILIGSAGINGDLSQTGTITVTGGNPKTSDVSYGIQSLGRIGGSATISGSISVVGQNATAVALDGGVGGVAGSSGYVDVNATLTSTGYELTSPYQISSLQALVQAQAAEELLQGGATLRIQGVVTGGISLDQAIDATGTTTAVAGAVITSYGSAPGVQIGGTTPTIISPITTASAATATTSVGYGLVVGGSVSGLGTYAFDNNLLPVNATGVQIGSSSWAPVTLNGGLSVTGTIEASTVGAGITKLTGDTGTGNAVAVSIDNAALTANGASGAINISGVVTATTETQTTAGTSLAAIGAPAKGATINPPSSTAILLGSKANVPSLINSGTIQSLITGLSTTIITAGGGTQGYATAISDQSGTLTSVTNQNTISAKVAPILATDLVDQAYSDTVAIDLSHNTTGATVTQALASTPVTAVDSTTGLTTTVVPAIYGDVLFGSGNGTLNLNTGILEGGLQFGAGANTININGGSVALGALAQAQGGSLTLNIQNGILGIAAPVSNELASTLDSTNHITPPLTAVPSLTPTVLNVSSINIGAKGQLVLSVFAPTATYSSAVVGAPQFNVSGAINIASGGDIGLNFLSKLTSAATYDIIQSTGAISIANQATALGQLPYIYQGQLNVVPHNGANAIEITVSQKAISQLGFNPAQAAAYNAFYTAFDKTDVAGSGNVSGEAIGSVADTVLTQTTKADFDHLYNQFLPDYSGGAFETLTMGQDALAAAEADTPPKLGDEGGHGWVQEIGFAESRSSKDVVGFDGKGFGIAGGTETVAGANTAGIAMALLTTNIDDTGRPVGSTQTATAIEGGAYWRRGGDGLNLAASVNGGWVFLQSHRVLLEQSGTDTATFLREAKSQSDGAVVSASFDVAYKATFGRYFIKPEAQAEYVLLYESAYAETGGGDAVDLNVNSRLNQQGIVQGDVVLGATYGTVLHWTPELTVGWREIVAGGPASTTAHFNGGQSFTLSPEYQDLKGGLLARLGLRASGAFADFNANAGGVFGSSYNSVDARATARFLF